MYLCNMNNDVEEIFEIALDESLDTVEVGTSKTDIVEITLDGFYNDAFTAKMYKNILLHPGITYCRLEQSKERQKAFIYINKFNLISDVTKFFEIIIRSHLSEEWRVLDIVDCETDAFCSIPVKILANVIFGFQPGIFKVTEPAFEIGNENYNKMIQDVYFLLMKRKPSWRELTDELLKMSFISQLLLSQFKSVRSRDIENTRVSVIEMKSKTLYKPLFVKASNLIRMNAFDMMGKDIWTNDLFCRRSLSNAYKGFKRVFPERSVVAILKDFDTEHFYVSAAIVMREMESKERLLSFYKSPSSELWFGEKKLEIRELVHWLEDKRGYSAEYRRSEFIEMLNARL